MTAGHLVQGFYAAWLVLGFAVVGLAVASWWRVRWEKRPATFFAIGIASVWCGSAWLLRPWWIYVGVRADDDPAAAAALRDHPFVMVAVVIVIVGGVMLVRGFTYRRYGNIATVLACVAVVVSFAVGAAAGWLGFI